MRSLWVVLAVIALGATAQAQKIVELQAKPLSQNVTPKLSPVKPGKWKVPVITWGGDVATIVAAQENIFSSEGLQVELIAENDFAKQVQMALNGEIIAVRGTMGMINTAAEVFKAAGTEMVVIVQLTWSNGGDALVARGGINNPAALKGKTIALQLYGPHMDYSANVLSSAGVNIEDVKFRWFKELTLPTFDTKGTTIDPVSVFRAEKSVDAVMCIIPDALALTSNGTKGTGAEGSVKDATILLSTKTANRVIADVYGVRKDVYLANKDKFLAFSRSLLKGQEALDDLRKNKATKQAKYQQVLAKSADLLLGAPQATADVEALLGDCEFVGLPGNVAFFTGTGTTRNFAKVNDEVQASFIKLGLMSSAIKLEAANWPAAELGKGLKNTSLTASTDPKFDAAKVGAKIEERLKAEPESFSDDGTLFQVEINFAPNQADFSAEKYAKDYQRALELAQTYAGAVVLIEGHADPTGITRAKDKNEPLAVIAEMEQAIKNLSLNRSNAVRKSYLDFCKSKGIAIDESQFLAVGVGTKNPKYPKPKDKEEWASNRRVVFRIKQIEAELNEFQPAGK
jgi:outer membrane protein OmpA-like peptidoglycan-associated protein/ABC-type nitrate/sulfonate/bicarbonate transport system substrate-binding protein